MVNKAKELFARMKQLRLRPTFVTFNSLIDVFVRVNQMKDAWKHFAMMRTCALKPDNFTCSTLIKGIKPSAKQLASGLPSESGRRDMQVAFDLLDQMHSNPGQFRERPDEVLYNCMIDMCVRFRDLPSAIYLFD